MKSKRIPLPTVDPMAVAALSMAYAQLPYLPCKGLCQDCCGPIRMSRVELDRLTVRLGHRPKPPDKALNCSMLDLKSGRCTVYDIRPFICRLWGLVEEMKCPFGCKPERWVSDVEAYRLMSEVADAGK